MNDVFVKIAELKLVPVVKIEKAEDALALGQALLTGGLPLRRDHLPDRRSRGSYPHLEPRAA